MSSTAHAEPVASAWAVVTGVGLLAGLQWWLLLRWSGIHITSDSVGYFLLSFRMSWGQFDSLGPTWPPLYPGLIWLLNQPLVYPTVSAALLSGASLAMVVASVGRLTLQCTRGTLLAVAAGLFCCVWGPLLYVFRYAWSEPLYTSFTMVHLVAIAAHLRHGRLRDYAIAALFAAAAASTRYIGDSLVVVFALYSAVYLGYRRAPWRAWVRHGAAALLPLLPLLLWLARNKLTRGTLHGERTPSRRTLSENVGYLWEALGGQLWAAPLLSAVLGGALLVVLWQLWRDHGRLTTRLAVYMVTYLAVYCAALLYATSTVHIDQISARMTMPLLPVCLVLVAAAYGGLQERLTPAQGSALRGAGVVVLLAGALGNLPATASSLQFIASGINAQSGHEQSGYNSSETAAQINALLAAELRERPHIAAMVLTPPGNGYKSIGLWARPATLEGSGLSLVGFTGFSSQQFSIAVALDGQPREISAWLHQKLATPEDIAAELVTISARTGELEVLVLTRTKLLRKAGVPGADLAQLSGLVACTEAEPLPPYRVYRCAL